MADETIALASLSLTHVYYDPSDPISYVCAWLALMPQALCVVYATLVWSTREAEVALMFAGQLACEAVNFALKRLIKEERPRVISTHGKGYGMPSSHAQFVAFWAVALTLFLMLRHRPADGAAAARRCGGGSTTTTTTATTATASATASAVAVHGNGHQKEGQPKRGRTGRARAASLSEMMEAYPHRPWSLLERGLVSLLALLLAAAVAWSRVYLNYHTVWQVIIGLVAGTLSAVAWFVITAAARQLGLLAWAIEFPLAKWLRVRDLVVEEDLCQAGWEKWEDKKAAAGTKRPKDE